MGFQNDRKPAKDKIWVMQQVMVFKMTDNQRRTEFILCSRYDCSSGSHRIPSGLLSPVSWFLPVLPGSLCFVFFCGCCSESEDSLNLS